MQYVFNIGFNKSGTTSLCSALNILGIPSIHYYSPNGLRIKKIIEKNISSKKRLLESLDDKYFGFSDFSGQSYYQQLYDQYPNSKFIFTIRNADDWIKSLVNHKLNNREIHKREIGERNKKLLKRYEKNSAEIREFFSPYKDQFLEMRICDGEGWEVLCPFLGLEIPSVPFPYENKTLYKK